MMRSLRARVAVAIVALVVASVGVGTASPAGAGAAGGTPVTNEAEYLTALGALCIGQRVISIEADIVLTSGTEPTFTRPCDLTIRGNGHTIDGNGNSRSVVEYTYDLGTLQVLDLVAVNGQTPAGADAEGGAIQIQTGSELVVANSMFIGNESFDDGGAINAQGGAQIHRSAFIGNTAGDDGGGARLLNGSNSVWNSTFALNTAADQGGGLNTSQALIRYATIASNTAPSFANAEFGPGTVLLNVVLSDPRGGGANCEGGNVGPGTSSSYSTDGSCTLPAGQGNVSNGADPLLSPPSAGWWGPQRVMVPAASSPLLDKVQMCGLVGSDQRLVPRPQGAGCDIGAVERDLVPPKVTVTGVTSGATYVSGSVPAAGCTTTDSLSGVAKSASVSIDGPANGVGQLTATCSGATDKEGNVAGPVSVTYNVVFNAADAWYGMVETDGTVYTFPSTKHQGNAVLAAVLGESAVDFVINNDGTGYYVLTSFGRVLPFGPGSANHGDLDLGILDPGESVEAMALTETGDGYWIFTSRGRAVTFGDAPDIGGVEGLILNAPVVDASPYPPGFYMAAGDGGVFTPSKFAGSQQVPFFGSMGGVPLNEPVVTIYVDASDNLGYTLAAADGGMFNFNSKFCSSVPAILPPGGSLNQPVVNAVPWGTCYLVFAADGGAFNFSAGELPFLGSLGDNPPDTPITSGDAYFH